MPTVSVDCDEVTGTSTGPEAIPQAERLLSEFSPTLNLRTPRTHREHLTTSIGPEYGQPMSNTPKRGIRRMVVSYLRSWSPVPLG